YAYKLCNKYPCSEGHWARTNFHNLLLSCLGGSRSGGCFKGKEN
ncbi:unnamed protein product, partial [Gulo gulo]